jgi:hypothetical protein
MNFKILQVVNNNTKTSSKKSKYIEPKYSKILNNLLSINSLSDSAIFSKLNFLNKDLNKILKSEDITKIYTKFDFKIKIKKTSMASVEKLIQNSTTPDELIQTMEDIDYKPTGVLLKQISKEFEKAKKIIIDKISEDNNIFLTK